MVDLILTGTIVSSSSEIDTKDTSSEYPSRLTSELLSWFTSVMTSRLGIGVVVITVSSSWSSLEKSFYDSEKIDFFLTPTH